MDLVHQVVMVELDIDFQHHSSVSGSFIISWIPWTWGSRVYFLAGGGGGGSDNSQPAGLHSVGINWQRSLRWCLSGTPDITVQILLDPIHWCSDL